MAMSHLFEFQQIRAVLDLPYLEKIDVAVPANLKSGNCAEATARARREIAAGIGWIALATAEPCAGYCALSAFPII